MEETPREFEVWYRSEHGRVLGTLILVFGSVDTAAECADEAFARAVNNWSRVQTMESPGGWVMRVALNLGRRSVRRSALEQRLLRRSPPPLNAPGPVYEVWDSVRKLPVRQRTAVVLRYIADLPEAEIASVMGVSRGTVASTLHDARRALRLDVEADETNSENVEAADARR